MSFDSLSLSLSLSCQSAFWSQWSAAMQKDNSPLKQMRAADWGASLRQARVENPGALLAEISRAASVIHDKKRQGEAPKTRTVGKQSEANAAPKKVCLKWGYAHEQKGYKPQVRRRIPVRSVRGAVDVD